MRTQRNNIIRKFIIVSFIILAMKHTHASDECRMIFSNKIKSPFFTTVTTHNDKNQAIKEIHEMMPDENAQDYTIIVYIQQIPPTPTKIMTRHAQSTNQNLKTRDFLLTWTSKQHAIQFINEHALDQNQQIYFTVVRKENTDTKPTTTPSPEDVINNLERLSSNLENALENVKDKKNLFQNAIMAIKKAYLTAKIAQNTWPNLKNNIKYMENIMQKKLKPTELQNILQKEPTFSELQNIVQKELTPTEYKIVINRLQNQDQNYTDTIPIFYISIDTVEKQMLYFNEMIEDIDRLRSNVTEATKVVVAKAVIFKKATLKAQEIWPSLNIITQMIDNAFKEHHITHAELEEIISQKARESSKNQSQKQDPAPLQAKTPHEKKDDIPTGSNVLRFPTSKIERLRR